MDTVLPDTPPASVRLDQYADGSGASRHQHEQGQWIYALSGMMRIYTEAAVWTLPPLRALWIPPHEPHQVSAVGIVQARSLYIEPEHALVCPMQTSEVSPLVEAMMQVLQEENGFTPRAALLIPALLHELKLAQPALDIALPLPQERRLRRVCEALMQQPANNDQIELWGVRIGASARTLARLFKDETGLSFSQWRDQLRVAEARTRLARGEPVNVIARKLGYQSSSAFIAMFRRVHGASPLQA